MGVECFGGGIGNLYRLYRGLCNYFGGIMKYKVTLAIREVYVYDYEVEAEDREQAKDGAWAKHYAVDPRNPDEGKCVVREEVVHQIYSEDEEEEQV